MKRPLFTDPLDARLFMFAAFVAGFYCGIIAVVL